MYYFEVIFDIYKTNFDVFSAVTAKKRPIFDPSDRVFDTCALI